ncbi:MAG TPA: DMT family transporter [Acidimicrobiales bacterium]|nr:DMT family transporter [Acidimicrobiales bacterium]
MNANRAGAVAAAASALGYSFTVTFGAALARDGLGAPVVLSIRFALSGLALLGLCRLLGRPLLPAPGQWRRVFLLGAVVYAAESGTFFSAVVHSSAATAAVVVYVYPVLVTLFEAVMRRRPPTRHIRIALCLSVGGTALVAGAGGHVELHGLGFALGLASATLFAVYLMVGSRVTSQSDPFAAAGWVALGAAWTFGVISLAGPGYGSVGGHLPALVGNGVANIVAFGMMFAALQRLSPSRAAVVFTLEAVFAVILSALVLGEVLAPLQAVGAAGVLLAAVVVLRAESEPSIAERELAAL